LSPFKIESGYFSSVKWGTYAIGLSFLRQIFLVPVFIITVGSYGYSFWLILSTIVIMITALNLGHLHYSANLLNFIYHKKEDVGQEMVKIQSASLIYGLLQLLVGICICYPPVFSYISGFPENYIRLNNTGIAFILLLAGKFFLQYTSAFTLRLFEPVGRINTTLKYQAIGEAADLAATIITIYFTRSIFYTCLVVFLVNIAFTILTTIFVSNNVPFNIAHDKGLRFTNPLSMLRGSFVLNTSFLVEKIYEAGLNLIVVRVFGTAVVPLFTTSRVLTNIFYRICTVMVVPLFPVIQKEYALDNQDSIISKMKVFWSLLSMALIVCITIGMPLLPYIYNLWTHNKLEFNLSIICFLFMAVSFQNFGMIINEFFKKTNLSKQILTFNVLKCVITIATLSLFGYYSYLAGLGLALFIAEMVCAFYSILILIGIFKNKISVRVIATYLVPVILFCLSLSFYLYKENYWLFLLFNSAILFFTRKKDIFNTLKRDM
jgi:hypothetical protein